MTVYEPDNWESGLMYAKFTLPAGKTNVDGVELSFQNCDVVNMYMLMNRDTVDVTTYLADEFHLSRDTTIMDKTKFISYCHKFHDVDVAVYQFPGKWYIDVNFKQPLDKMPTVTIHHAG